MLRHREYEPERVFSILLFPPPPKFSCIGTSKAYYSSVLKSVPSLNKCHSLAIQKLILLFSLATSAIHAAPPDLTAEGVIAGLSPSVLSETYNLGPTGLRGWIYISRGSGASYGPDGTMTDESRQIIVTVASTPASAVLQVNDVILGAMPGSSGTVPYFSSDARKAFGVAIGDAEKTGAGILRVKRWRGGTITDVNIPITIMGDYSATAPYSCPRSSLILANARNKLVADLLANPNYFQNYNYASAISGLALLASVQPGDPNYAAVQTRLQTYARSLSTEGLRNDGLDIWNWAYVGIFLSEYYLSTGDTQVLSGINQFALKLSQSQSMYGTFGHNPAIPRLAPAIHRNSVQYLPDGKIISAQGYSTQFNFLLTCKHGPIMPSHHSCLPAQETPPMSMPYRCHSPLWFLLSEARQNLTFSAWWSRHRDDFPKTLLS